MNEAKYVMKNYGDLGGCYPPWLFKSSLLMVH